MPQDVAQLVPRVRRALEGPLPVDSTLTDEQVTAVAADAVADLILLTQGEWPYTLSVANRDGNGYPDKWEVSPELSPDNEGLVAWQAAITAIGTVMRDMKVSETVRNEAQEWSYQRSATVMRDWLKTLVEQRDAALKRLEAANPVYARVASLLATRDAQTAALIEPWVAGVLVR
jgi:hypothetical protein